SLKGGSANDIFALVTGGSVPGTGTIDGAGGSDTLDYSGFGAVPVSVNLQTSAATAVKGGGAGGFTSIEALIGNDTTSATANTTLIGPDIPAGAPPAFTTATWTLTNTNNGNVTWPT